MTSHVKLTLHQTSSFAPVLQPIMRGTPLKLLDCNRNSFYLKFSAALSTTIYMVITGPLRSNFAKICWGCLHGGLNSICTEQVSHLLKSGPGSGR